MSKAETLHRIKTDRAARLLIKNNFNATKTACQLKPNNKYTSNNSNSKAIINNDIIKRAAEILAQHPTLNKKTICESLTEDLQATRPIVVDKSVEFVRDNANILETKKVLLKLQDELLTSDASQVYNDQRSINLSLNDTNLVSIANALKDIKSQLESDRERRGKAFDKAKTRNFIDAKITDVGGGAGG